MPSSGPTLVQSCPRLQNVREEQSSLSVICETGPFFFSHFSRWTQSLSHTSTFTLPILHRPSVSLFVSCLSLSLPWRFLRFLHSLPSRSLDIWSAPIKLTRLLSKVFTRRLPTVNLSLVLTSFMPTLPPLYSPAALLHVNWPFSGLYILFVDWRQNKIKKKKKNGLQRSRNIEMLETLEILGDGWMWVASRSDG